jgi:hypothetical protein
MKATIKLEYIGEAQESFLSSCKETFNNISDKFGDQFMGNHIIRRPWIAEIFGTDKNFKFKRNFLKGNWQRKRSNSTGSRGVEIWFTLVSGKLYEAKSFKSWRSIDRYFCIITNDGNVNRLTEIEAMEWLKDHLE